MQYGITDYFGAWIRKKLQSFFTLSLDSIYELLERRRNLSTAKVSYNLDLN